MAMHITMRKPRLKGWYRSRERAIRRGTTTIVTIRRNTTTRIFTEARVGIGRIPRKKGTG
jgi:hypothetical protein